MLYGVLEYIFKLLILTYFFYIIIKFLIDKFQLNKNYNDDDEDDMFFDNAPLPKSPSPLPPIQDEISNAETLEQMQFREFMKKYKEDREREKVSILRE